jgi:ABC-type sugar transport system, permease component
MTLDKVLLKNNRTDLYKLLVTLIISIFGFFMVVPFVWMISASMKYEVDVFKFPIEWIPQRTRLIKNYADVWAGEAPFALYYYNSIKVTVISTLIALLIGSLAAYGFSKVRFAGRDKIFLIYIATMVIPDQVTMLPRFIYFKWLGIYDSHICLIVSVMFSITTIFFLRQSMMGVPNELSDSARIDGAGHLRIYWQIILPLTKPSIATLGILKFIWTWNDYQNPLIFLTNPKLFTIQLGVKMFSDRYGSYYSLIMAAAVSAILPLFIVFAIGQKYVIEGITAGSIKG